MADEESEDSDHPSPTVAGSHADAALKIRGLPKSPWVFRKMLLYPPARVANGSFCGLRSKTGELIAHGFVNRRSEIAFRIVGGPADADLATLLRARIGAAHDLRTQVLRLHEITDAARIVHGEADGLSGLVVDRYGRVLSVLVYSLGYVRNAEVLEAELRRLPDVDRVVFQADPRSAELEGFSHPRRRRGAATTEVHEHGVRFQVDLAGAAQDRALPRPARQPRRSSRATRAASACSTSARTRAGSPSTRRSAARRARSSASTSTRRCSSGRARTRASNDATVDFVHADLFDWLRDAKHAAPHLRRSSCSIHTSSRRAARSCPAAMRKYHDMNALAFGAVAPRGPPFTFSCSGVVSETAFGEVVADAARAAGRRARVLRYLGAAPDHPVALDFPEGRYLKGLMLQVD